MRSANRAESPPPIRTARADPSPHGSPGTSRTCRSTLLAHPPPCADPVPPCPAPADPSCVPLGLPRALLLPQLKLQGVATRGRTNRPAEAGCLQWVAAGVQDGGQSVAAWLQSVCRTAASAGCFVLLCLCGRKCQIAWVFFNTNPLLILVQASLGGCTPILGCLHRLVCVYFPSLDWEAWRG